MVTTKKQSVANEAEDDADEKDKEEEKGNDKEEDGAAVKKKKSSASPATAAGAGVGNDDNDADDAEDNDDDDNGSDDSQSHSQSQSNSHSQSQSQTQSASNQQLGSSDGGKWKSRVETAGRDEKRKANPEVERTKTLEQSLKIIREEKSTALNVDPYEGKKLGDAGCALFAEALVGNRTLLVLDLANNSIGAEGAQLLSNALKKQVSLQQLLLGENFLGSRGVSILLESLTNRCALMQQASSENLNSSSKSDSRANSKGKSKGKGKDKGKEGEREGEEKGGDVGSGDEDEDEGEGEGDSIRSPLSADSLQFFSASSLASAGSLRDLEVLDISGNGIGDRGCEVIADSLTEDCVRIASLSIANNGISPEGCKPLAKALESNGSLKSLDVSDNDSGDEGTGSLADSISRNDSLEELLLQENDISDEGARQLSYTLRRNNSLKKLSLEGNDITDEGVQHLADSLRENSTLSALILRDNEIGKEGPGILHEVLSECETPSLAVLDLRQNSIGLEGARKLRAFALKNNSLAVLETDKIHLDQKLTATFDTLNGNPTEFLLSIRDFVLQDAYDHAAQLARRHGDMKVNAITEGWIKARMSSHPLVNPPMSVVQRGPENIKAFFDEISHNGVDPTPRCKLMLLGNAKAGKTSLIRSLMSGNKSRLTKDGPDRATISVATDRWQAQHTSKTSNSDSLPPTLSVFDYGGQREYLATHALFLSNRSLTLLVFDLTEYYANPDQCFEESVLFWLRKIRVLAPGAHFIVVATHRDKFWRTSTQRRLCNEVLQRLKDEEAQDVASLKKKRKELENAISAVSQAEGAVQRAVHLETSLREVEERLSQRPTFSDDVIRVSSRSTRGLKHLHNEILRCADIRGVRLPLGYVKLENEFARFSKVLEQKGIPDVLSLNTVKEMAVDECNIPEHRVMEALDFLHDLGSILFYRTTPELSEVVFTRPPLVIDAIKQLIRHDMVEPDEGGESYISRAIRRSKLLNDEEWNLEKVKDDLTLRGLMPVRLLESFDVWQEMLEQGRLYFDALVSLVEHFSLGYAKTQGSEEIGGKSYTKGRAAGQTGSEYLFLPFYLEGRERSGTMKSQATSQNGDEAVASESSTAVGDGSKDDAKQEQQEALIADWRYLFPTLTPPGLFERLLVRFQSIDTNEVQADVRALSATELSKTLTEPARCRLSLQLVPQNQGNAQSQQLGSPASATKKKTTTTTKTKTKKKQSNAGTGSGGAGRKGAELVLQLYSDALPHHGGRGSEVSDDSASKRSSYEVAEKDFTLLKQNLWDVFRHHSQMVEELLVEFPGLDTLRAAVSPDTGERFSLEACEQARTTGQLYVYPLSGGDPVRLEPLIGPPTAKALVLRPGAPIALPEGLKCHVLIVSHYKARMLQCALIANELRSRGLVVWIAQKPEMVGTYVKASFCVLGFLSKDVFSESLVCQALVRAVHERRPLGFFMESRKETDVFDFATDSKKAPKPLRPLLKLLQTRIVYTRLQSDRQYLAVDMDNFVEHLSAKIDADTFGRLNIGPDMPGSDAGGGKLSLIHAGDFEESVWRQMESWARKKRKKNLKSFSSGRPKSLRRQQRANGGSTTDLTQAQAQAQAQAQSSGGYDGDAENKGGDSTTNNAAEATTKTAGNDVVVEERKGSKTGGKEGEKGKEQEKEKEEEQEHIPEGEIRHLDSSGQESIGGTKKTYAPMKPLPDGTSYHVFLSHYQKTGGYQCHLLFTELEYRGLKVWYDMNQQDRNVEGMRDGVRSSSVYLLFLSKGVLSRLFVMFELACAIESRKPIFLMHESDNENDVFDFDKEVEEAPQLLQPVARAIFDSVPSVKRPSDSEDFASEIDKMAEKLIEMASREESENEIKIEAGPWKSFHEWITKKAQGS